MIRGLPIEPHRMQVQDTPRQRATADFGAAAGLRPGATAQKAIAGSSGEETAVAEMQYTPDARLPAPSTLQTALPADVRNAAGLRTPAPCPPDNVPQLPVPLVAQPGAGAASEALRVESTYAVTAPATRDAAVPTPAPIATSVAVAGVVVETFDLPWTLAASGHLAWQVAGSSSVESIVDPLLLSAAQGRIVVGNQAVAIDVEAEAGEVAAERTLLSGALWISGTATGARVEAAADETLPVEVVSSGAAPADWQQRLLRSIERFEAVTLFVRDYRLDTRDAHALTEQLVHTARTERQSLSRVVVNGHTTWERHREERRHAG